MNLQLVLPTKALSTYRALVRIWRNMNRFDMAHQVCISAKGAWESAAFPFAFHAGCFFFRLGKRGKRRDIVSVTHLQSLVLIGRKGKLRPVIIISRVLVVLIRHIGWYQALVEAMMVVVPIVLKRYAAARQTYLLHTSRSLLYYIRDRTVGEG